MYVSVSTLFHAPNLKLFPTLCTSSSNLKCPRATSSESHLPRPSTLKRIASSNLLRKTPTMFELVKASSLSNRNDAHEALQTLEQQTFVHGSSEFLSGSTIESKLNRLVSNSHIRKNDKKKINKYTRTYTNTSLYAYKNLTVEVDILVSII